MGHFFRQLGLSFGAKARKAQWVWEHLTGDERDAVRAERRVGRDLAKAYVAQIPLDGSDELRHRLWQVGQHLEKHLKNRLHTFHYEITATGRPEACALPGGYVFIDRSLLELVGFDTDPVAFVLGHEMGHVALGHAIDRIVTEAALGAAVRAAPVGGVFGGWLKQTGLQTLHSAHSQEKEFDADRFGFQLVSAAGYEKSGAIRLFETLAQIVPEQDPDGLWTYFHSHPPLQHRIQALQKPA